MVLWSNLGKDCEVALRKCGHAKRKVRRSEQGKCRRGLKPDAAAGSTRKPERDHIRLRGVGFRYYRKSPGFPQAGRFPEPLPSAGSKWLIPHQNHDPDHQYGRYLIDNTVKFLTSGIPAGGEVPDAAGKKTV